MEAHHRSAKHQCDSFHETESEPDIFETCYRLPDFADKLLFVSFQQNKPISLFSNTVYECACIPHFN